MIEPTTKGCAMTLLDQIIPVIQEELSGIAVMVEMLRCHAKGANGTPSDESGGAMDDMTLATYSIEDAIIHLEGVIQKQ